VARAQGVGGGFGVPCILTAGWISD